MDIAEPQNDFQYIIYIVAVVLVLAPSLLYFTYLKFGKASNNDTKSRDCIQREDIVRIREFLATDNQRIKSLEESVKTQWDTIDGIKDKQHEFATEVIEKIGELNGSIKSNGS